MQATEVDESELFNERSPIRTDVLRALESILLAKLDRTTFPAPFWAFCQTADIRQLEKLADLARRSPDIEIARLVLEPIIKDCDLVVQRWLQQISVTPSSSSISSTSGRSSSASRSCKRRDNFKCIITGHTNPDASHIYPYSLIKASSRDPRAVSRFWDIIDIFWDSDRVRKWKEAIFGSNTAENPKDGCFNLLSLDKQLHSLWSTGRFALRPLECTQPNTIKVGLYWQQKACQAISEVDLLMLPQSTRGITGGQEEVLISTEQHGEAVYKPIASGDVFSISTHDAKNLPLPDRHILELQWHLQRIAGMIGASEISESYNDNSDDDVSNIACQTFSRNSNVLHWLSFIPETETEQKRETTVEVYQMLNRHY